MKAILSREYKGLFDMDDLKDIELLPDTIEIYERRIDDAIDEFCLRYNIESLSKAPQNTFSACLRFVYRHVFKPDTVQQSRRKCVLDYEKDMDILLGVLNYYLYICGLYDKAVSQYDFSCMTGLSEESIVSWRNSFSLDNELTKKRMLLIKALYTGREQSLSNKLLSGGNVVGPLAILNHLHGWNLPGVSREESKPRLSRSDMLQGLDALPVKPGTAADGAVESSQIPRLAETENE